MSVQFNHLILAARDRHASAAFFAQVFGLPEPTSWGMFTTVILGDGMHVQFAEPPVAEIQMQHVAFLVDDETFDQIYGRLQAAGSEHWADPHLKEPGRFNTNHGGRGVYFKDPAGHGLEVITRPYSDLG